MRSLTLLRHAKSAWDDPVERDFDRPLNGKGRRAAARMGRHMAELQLGFDKIIASPALRVIQTIDGVETGLGRTLSVDYDKRIYMASAVTLLDVIHGTSDDCTRLLMVGHNPGLEDLVLLLVPESAGGARDEVEVKYPTATLAELNFDGSWADLDERMAALIRFVRPRDLDPSLGPDAA
jgi:phosphohistidine phosphatase